MYLNKAEELLEEFPDSALKSLDYIVSPELLSEKDFHRYTLLQVQGKHKTRRDISKDTTLFKLRGYYDKSDPEKAAIIYLYSGVIYKAQDEYEDALTHYLNTERLDKYLDSNLKAKIQHFIGNLFFQKRDISESKKNVLSWHWIIISYMEILKM
ncbi:MAG: hypothetical protein LUF85_03230 [Bacteroides sp.]|nr:hypothetical protein [Bacteroides sp.]